MHTAALSQQWEQGFLAWSLGLAFAFIIFVTIIISALLSDKTIKSINIFAPLVRMLERQQQYRQDLKIKKLDLQLRKDNPAYTAYLEEKGKQLP